MPSELCNSTMAKAMGLNFSLFDVTQAQEVPFGIPLYTQCILHGLTSALICVPIIFAHREKCRFCGNQLYCANLKK